MTKQEEKTEQKQSLKALPRLIRQSATYKLIVPENVEEKIRYLLRKYPQTEWSGVLFYKHTGSFEKGTLKITCEDIYPMDLGTSVYTEFKMTPDVTAYIADNIELFDCETGILHSHHLMSTQFSGTDISTLQKEGNDTNCFVSLIVNTAGAYSAAITRKVHNKKEVSTKDLGSTYEFFGDGIKKIGDRSIEKESVEEEVIEYFMLDVERHEVRNPFGYLDDRFEDIVSNKQKNIKVVSPRYESPNTNDPSWWPRHDMQRYGSNIKPAAISDHLDTLSNRKAEAEEYDWLNYRKPDEPYLFDDETMDSLTLDNPYDYVPDSNLIHQAVCRMVSCSLILNTEKFDLEQWILHHMDNLYNDTFHDDQQFKEWAEFVTEHLVYHFEDQSCPPEIENDWYYGSVAQAMIEELTPYKDNKYIQQYINELSVIIV